MQKRKLLLCLIALAITGQTMAQLVFQESFNYAPGALNGQGMWSGNPAVQVAVDDMTLADYPLQNTEAKVAEIRSAGFGNPSEIDRTNVTGLGAMAGSAYLSFLAKVPDVANLPTFTDYQVGFRDALLANNFAGVGFYYDGSNVRLAVLPNSFVTGIVTTPSPGSLLPNTVYHVVLKYTIAPTSDLLSVYISPVYMATEPVTPALQTTMVGDLTNLGAIRLRSQDSTNPILHVDGIIVSNTWPGADILPVELAYFRAKEVGDTAQLSWATRTETNNDYFTVERCGADKVYHPIGKVAGAGQSTVPLNYSLLDPAPLEGISYYRLKQTDFDGTTTYSEVRSLRFDQGRTALKLYPNPATDRVLLETTSAQVYLYDQTGKRVFIESKSQIFAGKMELDVSHLAPGVYFLSTHDDPEQPPVRLVVE